MTALCYRAIGNSHRTYEILGRVLEQVPVSDPFRGNPLQVLGWMARDEGRLEEAENFFKQALEFQACQQASDILIAGSLADLGEVMGLQGRIEEAKHYFEESLKVLAKYTGQYNRHEARTKIKLAELLIFTGNDLEAHRLLNAANDQLSTSSRNVEGIEPYHDVLWRTDLLLALIYFRQGYAGKSFRKLRSAFRHRQRLELSTWLLIKKLIVRLQIILNNRGSRIVIYLSP